MNHLIKVFSDGSQLEYDRGKFDDWCIYLTRPHIYRYPPRDVQYFVAVKIYAEKYSAALVYADFVAIYEITGRQLEARVLRRIEGVSQKYVEDALNIEILLTLLYAAMVAEENKRYTRLGKRVKRLGLHQILCEGMSPAQAAHFSRGKRWYEIAAECDQRGF